MSDPVPGFVPRHLARPTGWFGRLVMAPLLDRLNAEMNRAALEAMGSLDGARVLEVGFGGGHLLDLLLRTTPAARIDAVDWSPDMVARARRRFAAAVVDGRLGLDDASVDALPFPAGHFDVVVSVNCAYFWRPLSAGLEELRRVSTPGGRLVLGLNDPASFELREKDGFLVYTAEELSRALEAAGFVEVEVRRQMDRRQGRTFVVIARSPGPAAPPP